MKFDSNLVSGRQWGVSDRQVLDPIFNSCADKSKSELRSGCVEAVEA